MKKSLKTEHEPSFMGSDCIIPPINYNTDMEHIFYLIQNGAFMLTQSIKIFFLREVTFAHFDYPRWQSILVITLIGVLVGLDPSLLSIHDMSAFPLWQSLFTSVFSTWLAFVVIVGILHWWVKRGARWDGRGDLFNLIAASWCISDLLTASLTALGVPPLFTLPLWLYSIWVGAHALSVTISKVSLGYSIGGITISLVLAILVVGVAFFVMWLALGMLGIA